MAKVKSIKSKDRNSGASSVRPKRGRHCMWSENAMVAAIEAVRNKQLSQRAACKTFDVPRCTLQVRLSGKTEVGAKPGHPTVMSLEQEEKVVDYACNRASMGIGFGRKQFLQYAGDFAKKHQLSFKNGRPSLRWWRGVKNRHQRLRLRQPEGTAAIRHQCMDHAKVQKYFACLKSIMDASNLHIKPGNIWNMDETGVQLDHKPGRIVAGKGSKYLHSRTSGNRETITIIGCVNAAGCSLPPHVIVKGKTRRSLNSFDTTSAPTGTTWSWSDSGWTKQGIALLWFTNSFLPNIGAERPQLLILDGHDSHNFMELIDSAIQNEVHIIELPAHTSNWLQPCDRTVFGPFKAAYRSACDSLMSSFPGTLVSRSNFCGLLNKAWLESVTTANIQSGFRACGIFPFCPDAIPLQAYQTNLLYSSRNNATNDNMNNTTSHNENSDGKESNTADNNVACINIANAHKENNNRPSDTTSTAEDDNSINTIGASNNTTSKQLNTCDVPLLNTVVNMSDYLSEDPEVLSTTCSAVPPHIALAIHENNLSSPQLDCFKFCYSKGYDLEKDEAFMTWKKLKDLSKTVSESKDESTVISELDISFSNIQDISLTSDLDLDLLITEEPNRPTELSHRPTGLSITDLQLAPLPLTEVRELLMEQLPVTELVPHCSHEMGPTEMKTSEQVVIASTPKYSFGNSSYPGDPDSDVLPYPTPVKRKQKSTKKQKFFLLTSKEAQEAKLKEVQERLDRDVQKKAKQEARTKRIQENIKKNQEKAEQKLRKKKTNHPKPPRQLSRSQKNKDMEKTSERYDRKMDMTPCATCSIRCCDDQDTVAWTQCQECQKWFHNSCQGLEEEGPDTFICITCEND